MANPTKKLTRRQADVLRLIIKDTRERGYPPQFSRLRDLTGNAGVHMIADRIRDRGYLKQLEPGGPYVPTHTPDGTPLRLELVEGEPSPCEGSDDNPEGDEDDERHAA